MKTSRILTLTVLLTAFLIFTVGCGNKGPKRFAVSGTITANGSPVSEGTLELRSASMTVGATINADGTFAIAKDKGPVEGEYTVAFNVPDPNAKTTKMMGQEVKSYKQIETEQKVQVAKGKNEFQLEIPAN